MQWFTKITTFRKWKICEGWKNAWHFVMFQRICLNAVGCLSTRYWQRDKKCFIMRICVFVVALRLCIHSKRLRNALIMPENNKKRQKKTKENKDAEREKEKDKEREFATVYSIGYFEVNVLSSVAVYCAYNRMSRKYHYFVMRKFQKPHQQTHVFCITVSFVFLLRHNACCAMQMERKKSRKFQIA